MVLHSILGGSTLTVHYKMDSFEEQTFICMPFMFGLLLLEPAAIQVLSGLLVEVL